MKYAAIILGLVALTCAAVLFYFYGRTTALESNLKETKLALSAEKDALDKVQASLAKSQAELSQSNLALSEQRAELESSRQNLSKAESSRVILGDKASSLANSNRRLKTAFGDLQLDYGQVKSSLQTLKVKNQDLKNYLGKIESLNMSDGKRIAKFEAIVQEVEEQAAAVDVKLDEFMAAIEGVMDDATKVERGQGTINVALLEKVLFKPGKAHLRFKARKKLALIGDALEKVGGLRVRIVGHTDNIPIAKSHQHVYFSNWELSAARAAKVMRFLIYEQKLDPRKTELVARAFHEPIADNSSVAGRRENRRVEIAISPVIKPIYQKVKELSESLTH